jgi:hypothetical protein
MLETATLMKTKKTTATKMQERRTVILMMTAMMRYSLKLGEESTKKKQMKKKNQSRRAIVTIRRRRVSNPRAVNSYDFCNSIYVSRAIGNLFVTNVRSIMPSKRLRLVIYKRIETESNKFYFHFYW